MTERLSLYLMMEFQLFSPPSLGVGGGGETERSNLLM